MGSWHQTHQRFESRGDGALRVTGPEGRPWSTDDDIGRSHPSGTRAALAHASGADALDECRLVLPGIQALFGFQLIAVFNSVSAGFDLPEERASKLIERVFGLLGECRPPSASSPRRVCTARRLRCRPRCVAQPRGATQLLGHFRPGPRTHRKCAELPGLTAGPPMLVMTPWQQPNADALTAISRSPRTRGVTTCRTARSTIRSALTSSRSSPSRF